MMAIASVVVFYHGKNTFLICNIGATGNDSSFFDTSFLKEARDKQSDNEQSLFSKDSPKNKSTMVNEIWKNHRIPISSTSI